MNIRSITIVQGTGPDKVMLETDYPSPCPDFDSHELCLDFDAAYDTGPAYVARNFPGVPVKLVRRPGNNYKFSRPADRRAAEEFVRKPVKVSRSLRP